MLSLDFYITSVLETPYHFSENFRTGLDTEGAAFALYENSRLVVDLWGGYADRESATKWREDTMSVAFSSTKVRLILENIRIVSEIYLSCDERLQCLWRKSLWGGDVPLHVFGSRSCRVGLTWLTLTLKLDYIFLRSKRVFFCNQGGHFIKD